MSPLKGDIFIIMMLIYLMPYRGFEPAACFDLWLATFHILEMLYDTPFPDKPQTDHIKKVNRNAEIIARYEGGETGVSLAEAYGISQQWVNQIVHGKRKLPYETEALVPNHRLVPSSANPVDDMGSR